MKAGITFVLLKFIFIACYDIFFFSFIIFCHVVAR